MNILIDIVLGVLCVLIIVKYTWRGFVKSIVGAVKLALTFILTFTVAPMCFKSDDIVTTLIAYLLVFALTFLILTVVSFFLNKLFELPILKVINKLLGAVLGIVVAYVSLCFVSAALNLCLNYAGEQLFGQTNQEIVNSTFIYKFFTEVNIFPLIGK